MYELAVDHYSPLSLATYDPNTGELYLEFDYDRLLDVNGEWRDGRHIDAVTFMGQAYPIIIHADDGPRDENGRYIFDRNTVDNIFTLNVGTGHDPADGTLSFGLTDREDGTGQLFTFDLLESEPTPANQAPVTNRDDATVGANDSILLDVLANDSDPEGGPLNLTFAVTEGAADIDVTVEDNQLRLDPVEGGRTDIIHTITYTVEDDQGAASQGLAVVTIEAAEPAPNLAPVAERDFASTGHDETILVDVLANDSDPEGGPLTLTNVVTESVSSIIVSIEDNQIKVNPLKASTTERIDTITYTVTDAAGASTQSVLVVDIAAQDAPPAADQPTLVYALNAGGQAYTAANGVTYEADSFANGNTFSTGASIAGTQDGTLYQTEKWAKLLEYEIAVENGAYDIELNFAEIWGGAQDAGKRVIDLYVEDELVFADLDLADDAGFLTALDIVGEVTVDDGALSIRAEGDVQNAKLAGFSIWDSEGALGDSFAVGSLYDDVSFA